MPAVPTPGVDTDWGTKLNAHLAVLLEPSTGALKTGLTLSYTGSSTPLTFSDGSSANNTLVITPTANKSASTSVGGALLINNTSSTGAALVIYSNQASPSGRLLVVRADHDSFNQAVVRIENDGTNSAISISAPNAAQTQPAISVATSSGGGSGSGSYGISCVVSGSGNTVGGSAANFVSANSANSCVHISGQETGRGSLKITHTYPDADDSNASALSIDVAGDGTAAKGIFVTSTASGGTTGSLLDLRNGSSVFRMKVEGSGQIIMYAASSAYGTSNMWNNSIQWYINEAGNQLVFQVKYAGGTVKTGTIALS